MSFLNDRAIALHKKHRGKLAVASKVPLETIDDLSLAYSPGVAAASRAIAADTEQAYGLTGKGNAVAVVSDGSAVLGLGNIGPAGALPVMEGKAILFKGFAGIDAYPIVLGSQDTDEIVKAVEQLAPGFGGINLEDISAPRCFEIEARLQELGIPVFHDDQHGTAIVVLAGLLNACRVVGKSLATLKVVVVGAGAAGTAVARLLSCLGEYKTACTAVKEVHLLNRAGVLHAGSPKLSAHQRALLEHINPDHRSGQLDDVIKGADVFIGVSGPGVLTGKRVAAMADKAIVFALANPDPEIDPAEATRAGAAVVATGRSDYPNQVNNVLAFPGIFLGALDARAKRIDDEMKITAAIALSEAVAGPTAGQVLPSPLDKSVAKKVADAVRKAAG